MKYSEFKKNVNTDVYNITENDFYIFVMDYKGITLTTVSKRTAYVMSTNTTAFENLKADERLRLLDLAMALAITPLAEREEEKRYYLKKILIPLLRENDDKWYSKPLLPNYGPCARRDREQNFQYQTIFTESEIEKMDITGFYKEEAE